MKKMITMLAVLAVAGVAMADLSISFSQTQLLLKAGEVPPPNSTKVVPAGSHLQLLWAPSATEYQNGNMANVGGNWLVGDEVLLLETVSIGGGRLTVPIGDVYTDGDVGADINTGYFFARLFDTDKASIGAGTWFVEMGLQGPALTEFDALVPSSTYSDSAGAALPNIPGAIDNQGLASAQVVPEPATIGLMGIAGLGMFLARRKVRA